MINLKNSKGFSLIELMITAAISSALILGFMHFMKQRLSESKYIESIGEIDRMTNSLRFYLQDKEACLNSLGGAILPNNLTTALPITQIKNRKNDVVQTIPTQIASAEVTKLEKVELFNTELIAPNSYGAVEIRITYDRDQKRSIGTNKIVKKLDIMVATGPNSEIAQCHTSADNAVETAYNKVCEDMGGELDTVTSKCHFFSLVKGQHSREQCKSLPDSIVFDTGTETMCRLKEGSEIPKGWTRYEDWSTTTAISAVDADCATDTTAVTASNISEISSNPDMYAEFPAKVKTGCTVNGHAWGNIERESCSFVCIEKAPCEFSTCREVTRTLRSTITERGHY